MKPRKWVIIVCACLLAAAGGMIWGVQRLEKSRNIEHILVQRLSAATGGEFSVGRVRLGFFSVYLQNVSASLSTHTFDATVHDIRVAFSLWKLIRTRGDFAKSISKIILISPAVDIRLKPASPSAKQQELSKEGSATLLSVFKNFPVRYLLVRKGTVALRTGKDGDLLVGEGLNGRVWDEERSVNVELRGTLASNRKNLFVSAAFSKTGERNRMSLRLDKARLQRPLRFRAASVTGGQFDGVFELSFPDSVTPSSLESSGWLHISEATCEVAGYNAPLTSITLSLSVVNTEIHVDSLACQTRGCALSAKGTWDLADLDTAGSSLDLRLAGLRLEAIPGFPPSLAKSLSSTAIVQGKLQKRKGESQTKFVASAVGITAFTFPVAVECRGSFDSTQATLDTIMVRGPALRCAASGIATFEKEPVAYSIAYNLSLDSLKTIPQLKGRFTADGTARGLGQTYFVDAVISGSSVSVSGVRLGSPQIHIATSNGKAFSFSTLPSNNAYFSATGIVDSLGGVSPRVACNAVVGPRLLAEGLALAGSGIAHSVDSVWAGITFKGTAQSFGARGQAGIVLHPSAGYPAVRGGIDFQIDKSYNDRAVHWQIAQKDLAVSDSIVPLRGQGSLCGDSIRIDSAVALTWLRISGLVRLGAASGPDLAVRCSGLPVAAVNRLFFKNRLPLSAGTVSGSGRILGAADKIRADAELHLRGGALAGYTGVETDAVIQARDTLFTILPLVVRRNGTPLIAVDTITNKNGLHYSGAIKDVDVSALLSPLLPEDFREEHELHGTVSCEFSSGPRGEAAVTVGSDGISLDSWRVQRIHMSAIINERGILVKSLAAHDSTRAGMTASGFIPWSIITESDNDADTLDAQFQLKGDLIASLGYNAGPASALSLPIAGSGAGVVDVALKGTRTDMQVTKAVLQIPRGVLKAKPYVPEDIKDISLSMTLDKSASSSDSGEGNAFGTAVINTVVSGTIGRRPVKIHSTHVIPQGFEPITLGFLDFGALLVSTPKRGIDVHVPGIMEIGAPGDVEFLAKAPFPEFALSGPLDRLCITGTWVMRSMDITFPPLDNVETHVKFDPFPYITWNLDLRPGNRKVMYYYDTGKNRKLMRFVECYVDPASTLSMRGRDLDNSFKLLGELRSNTGSVFFARTFDRNLDVGVDFVPQSAGPGKGWDNTPIIWGSAEAMSDTSRFDRVKLTLLVRDSVTGAWSERGRFYDPHFRVGNNIENMPGQTQRQFLADEGSKLGSFGGAGQFVSEMGEQYLHRILLQNLERRLARTLGLDVINVETSIASNYFNRFYTRQLDWNRWDYLTFANVGVTVGRYVLYDKVFLKWRTELVPVDTVLRPQYDVGFEFQPLQPILLDVNYGIYKGDRSLEGTPTVNLWLQLPIRNVRKLFDF